MIKQMHEKFLYPVVRVSHERGAGSGTIIYNQSDGNGNYLTFILTNHHVIDDLISYKEDWDSILKKKTEKEFKKRANIEIFSYVNLSTVDSSNKYRADIVAYDKQHDLAILKLDSPRKFESVAKIIPKDKIKDLRLFMEVVVSGCSMSHEPFCTFGQITFLKEIIEEKQYLMINAGMYFGSSGGALFLKDTSELIGVPSRLTGIQLGFGIDMVLHMGFAAHPIRLYEFFDEQELHFLYDPSDTYNAAMQRRKEKEEAATLALKQKMMQSRSGGVVAKED